MTKTATPSASDFRTNAIPANTSAGEIIVDLALAAATDGNGFTAPEVIKLAPRGKTETRDGRAFDFTPETLVSRFSADKIDIAVDLEHSLSAFLGDKSKGAIGWISKLEARADGLYGHVEWLEAGLAALKARTHRYISPTFRHDQYGAATWLHSVALVATPALADMPALAHADPHNNPENDPMTTKLAKLTAALGLNEEASEGAMLAALNAKLEGQVDKKTHEDALAKLSASEDALKEIKEAGRKAKLDTMFEAALSSKKMLPAEREDFEALAATEDGLARVEKILGARPAALGASGLDGKTPTGGDAGNEPEINPVQLAAEAQSYVAEMAAKNVTITIDRAIEHVKAQAANT
jgi:phage I-like protein